MLIRDLRKTERKIISVDIQEHEGCPEKGQFELYINPALDQWFGTCLVIPDFECLFVVGVLGKTINSKVCYRLPDFIAIPDPMFIKANSMLVAA